MWRAGIGLGVLILSALLSPVRSLVTPISAGDVSIRYVRDGNGTITAQTVYSYTFLCPTGEQEQYYSTSVDDNLASANVIVNCNDIVYTNRLMLRTWTPLNSSVINVKSSTEARILNADPTRLIVDRYIAGLNKEDEVSTGRRKRSYDGIVDLSSSAFGPATPASLDGSTFDDCAYVVESGQASLAQCIYTIVGVINSFQERFKLIGKLFEQVRDQEVDIENQIKLLSGVTISLQSELTQTRTDIKQVLKTVGTTAYSSELNQMQVNIMAQDVNNLATTMNLNNQKITEAVTRVSQQAQDMATTTFLDLSSSMKNLAAQTTHEVASLTQVVTESVVRLQNNINQLQTNMNVQSQNQFYQQQAVNNALLDHIAKLVNTQTNILNSLTDIQRVFSDLATIVVSNGYATLDVHRAYDFVKDVLNQKPFVKSQGIAPADLDEWKIIGARIVNMSSYTFYDKNDQGGGTGCDSVLRDDNWRVRMNDFYANKTINWRVPRVMNRNFPQVGDLVRFQVRANSASPWRYLSASCALADTSTCIQCSSPQSMGLCLRNAAAAAYTFRLLDPAEYAAGNLTHSGTPSLIGLATEFVLLGTEAEEGSHLQIAGASGGACLGIDTPTELLIAFSPTSGLDLNAVVSSATSVRIVTAQNTYLSFSGDCVTASVNASDAEWRVVPYFTPSGGTRRRSLDELPETNLNPIETMPRVNTRQKREEASYGFGMDVRTEDVYVNPDSLWNVCLDKPGRVAMILEPITYLEVLAVDFNTKSLKSRNRMYPGTYKAKQDGANWYIESIGWRVGYTGTNDNAQFPDNTEYYINLPITVQIEFMVVYSNGVTRSREYLCDGLRGHYVKQPVCMYDVSHTHITTPSDTTVTTLFVIVRNVQLTNKVVVCTDIERAHPYCSSQAPPVYRTTYSVDEYTEYTYMRYWLNWYSVTDTVTAYNYCNDCTYALVCKDINWSINTFFGGTMVTYTLQLDDISNCGGTIGTTDGEPRNSSLLDGSCQNCNNLHYSLEQVRNLRIASQMEFETYVDECNMNCEDIMDRGTCTQAFGNQCFWSITYDSPTRGVCQDKEKNKCDVLDIDSCLEYNPTRPYCGVMHNPNPICVAIDEYTSASTTIIPCHLRMANGDSPAACIQTGRVDDVAGSSCVYYRPPNKNFGSCVTYIEPVQVGMYFFDFFASGIISARYMTHFHIDCSTPGVQCVGHDHTGPTDYFSDTLHSSTRPCWEYTPYPDECSSKAGGRCDYTNGECVHHCRFYISPETCVEAPTFGKCAWINTTRTCTDNTVDLAQRPECMDPAFNCATAREVCNLYASPFVMPDTYRNVVGFASDGFNEDTAIHYTATRNDTTVIYSGISLRVVAQGAPDSVTTDVITATEENPLGRLFVRFQDAGVYGIRLETADGELYYDDGFNNEQERTIIFEPPINVSVKIIFSGGSLMWHIAYWQIDDGKDGSACAAHPDCTWVEFDPDIGRTPYCEITANLIYNACFDENKKPLSRCNAGKGNDMNSILDQLKNECVIDGTLTGDAAIRECVLSTDASTGHSCIFAQITGTDRGSCYMPGSAALNAVQDITKNPIGATIWTLTTYLESRRVKDDLITASLNTLIATVLRPQYASLTIDNVRGYGLLAEVDDTTGLWQCTEPDHETVGRFCCPSDFVHTTYSGQRICTNSTAAIANPDHPFYRFVKISQDLCSSEGHDSLKWKDPQETSFPIYYMCKNVLVPGDPGYTVDDAFCPTKTNDTGTNIDTYRCYPFIEAKICDDLFICSRMGSLECSVEIQPNPDNPYTIRVVRLTPESMDAISSFLSYHIYNNTVFQLTDIDGISSAMYESEQDIFYSNLTDSPIELLSATIGKDILDLITTKTALYGDNPRTWDATPGEGLRASRGPPQVVDGKYVVKTDEYTFASISERMLPIYEYRFGQYQTNPTLNITGGDAPGLYNAVAVAIIDDYAHENPQDGDLFMFERLDDLGIIVSPPSSMMVLSGNAVSRCGNIPYLHTYSTDKQTITYDEFVNLNPNWDPTCFRIHPQMFASRIYNSTDPDDPDYCGQFYVTLDNSTQFTTAVGADTLRLWGYVDSEGTPLDVWWNETISETALNDLMQFVLQVKDRWKAIGCPRDFQNFIDVTLYSVETRVGHDFLRDLWLTYNDKLTQTGSQGAAMDYITDTLMRPQFNLGNNVYCGNCGLGYTTQCLLENRIIQSESDNSARKGACVRSRHKKLQWDKSTGIMRAVARSSTARMLVTFESPVQLDLNVFVNTNCPQGIELSCPPASSLCIMRAVNPGGKDEGSIVITIEVQSDLCPSSQRLQIPPGGVISPTIPLCDGKLRILVYNFNHDPDPCFETEEMTVNITAGFNELLDSQINTTFTSVVQTFVASSLSSLNSQIQSTIDDARAGLMADIGRVNTTFNSLVTDVVNLTTNYNTLLQTTNIQADIVSHMNNVVLNQTVQLFELHGASQTLFNLSTENRAVIDSVHTSVEQQQEYMQNVTESYNTVINAAQASINEISQTISNRFSNISTTLDHYNDLLDEYNAFTVAYAYEKAASAAGMATLQSPWVIAGIVVGCIVVAYAAIGASIAIDECRKRRKRDAERSQRRGRGGGHRDNKGRYSL